MDVIIEWKKALFNVARCEIKQGSCSVVPSSVRKIQAKLVQRSGLTIEVKPDDRILGMFITGTGSDTVNRRLVISRLQATFSRNQAVLCREWLDEEARLRFWGTLMRGALYGVALLRPLLETCTRLATVNNGVVRRIQNVLRQPWENVTLHRKHVNAELKVARNELGLDIELEFCKYLIRWVGHVWRHPKCQFFKLLHHQNDAWLRFQRSASSSDRPGTRSEPGCVFRWAQSWVDLIDVRFSTDLSGQPVSGWSFEKADKDAILCRAEFLKSWIRPAAPVSGSIEDQADALVPVIP